MSPFELRKAGRAAFQPGADPNDHCPYRTWGDERRHWMIGWAAEQSYMEAMLASDRVQG